MVDQYKIHLELVGDLDAVAKLITILRKCRAKANVKEMHVEFNGNNARVTLLVETGEIEWLINKLSTMYELQELAYSS